MLMRQDADSSRSPCPIAARAGDSRPGSVGSGRRPSRRRPEALSTGSGRRRTLGSGDEPPWSIGRLLRAGAPVRAGPQARARRGQRRAAKRSGAALIIGRRYSAVSPVTATGPVLPGRRTDQLAEAFRGWRLLVAADRTASCLSWLSSSRSSGGHAFFCATRCRTRQSASRASSARISCRVVLLCASQNFIS
jgi:hypothetical protein